MKMSRCSLLSLGFLVSLLAGNAPPKAQWKAFESKAQHFRVRYPVSWNRVEGLDGEPASREALDIINFSNSERVKGVVIKSSGAEIQVSGPPPNVHTIDDWIRNHVQDDVATDQREISIPNLTPNGCRSLKRVTWRSDVSGDGKAFFYYTAFYCSTNTDPYAIVLHNWDGDPDQQKLQDVALEIALSLRSLP